METCMCYRETEGDIELFVQEDITKRTYEKGPARVALRKRRRKREMSRYTFWSFKVLNVRKYVISYSLTLCAGREYRVKRTSSSNA